MTIMVLCVGRSKEVVYTCHLLSESQGGDSYAGSARTPRIFEGDANISEVMR